MTIGVLARSGLRVGSLGFGAAPIGNLHEPIGDDAAFDIVEAAWQLGVRYFDTAPHYGLGFSERRLGHVLRQHRRDSYVVSTKVGRLLVAHPSPTGSDLSAGGFAVPDTYQRRLDYSRDGVRRSLADSLERLGIDRVDIVYVHDPDDPEHLEQTITEAIPALLALRDQGVVRAVGVGMNYWEPLLRIVTETDVDVVMVAGRWTLLDRSAQPLLDACAESDVSVVLAAPFNSGILARPWPPDDALFDYRPATAATLAQARELASVCTSLDTTLPAAALQFPLRHPAVSGVVVGVRSPEQILQCVAWQRDPIPDELWPRVHG